MDLGIQIGMFSENCGVTLRVSSHRAGRKIGALDLKTVKACEIFCLKVSFTNHLLFSRHIVILCQKTGYYQVCNS